jgi:hypothetical protein
MEAVGPDQADWLMQGSQKEGFWEDVAAKRQELTEIQGAQRYDSWNWDYYKELAERASEERRQGGGSYGA